MIGQAAINAARHMGIEHPSCSGCCALSEELITWQKDYDSMCRMLAEPPAAAELLEALKDVIFLSDRKHEAWDKAKAAIAKAEAHF